jgi:23S rRNA pseudouridine2605 synthase
MPTERLQKLLASAGIASRREAEEFIREGRVSVNGVVVTEVGTKADPEVDHVKVDGKHLRIRKIRRYYLLNKPRGVVVTREDPEGRQTVLGLLGRRIQGRVVPVGRLDFESEGLLILTDDGDLVQKLTHPSGGCSKEYEVKVSGIPTPSQIARLSRGILLPDEKRKTAPATIELQSTTPEKNGVGGNAWVKVILMEGRSRQIRRMFDLVGHPVAKLRRVAIGPIRDKSLRPGDFRLLTEAEVKALQSLPKRGRNEGPPGAAAVRPATRPTGSPRGAAPVAARPPARPAGPGAGAPRIAKRTTGPSRPSGRTAGAFGRPERTGEPRNPGPPTGPQRPGAGRPFPRKGKTR